MYDMLDLVIYVGWMSNRGRQNVASYLVFDLGVDWRVGRWPSSQSRYHIGVSVISQWCLLQVLTTSNRI